MGKESVRIPRIAGIAFVVFGFIAILPAAADDAFSPSPLAFAIARAEFASFAPSDGPAAQADVLAFALEAERRMRFGASVQQARAELRRFLRLKASRGADTASRMSERLRKFERKSPSSNPAAANIRRAIPALPSGDGGGSGHGQSIE